MGRPKNSKNKKRDESKYQLPEGVALISDIQIYNKTTQLRFKDEIYGEFTSSFKALYDAGASTHPDAVQARREQTSVKRYGKKNAGSTKESRIKAGDTMYKRHGVRNALESEVFLKKSRETLMANHGVSHPMYKEEFRIKQGDSLFKSHGVRNPMKSELIKDNHKEVMIRDHGVENPMDLGWVRIKKMDNMVDSDSVMRSKEEKVVDAFIQSLGHKTRSKRIGGTDPKQIDIYIEDLKVAIEYHGAYWHSEANKKLQHQVHYKKYSLCKDVGIKLIQIFDFEWKNKNRQVKSFLRSALGKNEILLNGRSCDIREVENKEAKQFLDDFHILGKTNFFKAIGLYNKNELVSMVTINKHHRNSSEIVLNRYVGKENVTVRGGFSKLCKYLKLFYPEIYTWIDLRFSNGENWLNNGWELVHQLKPDYFYLDGRSKKIISKQSRQKKKVDTPEGMTEHEHALSEKLYRIYDCGKIKLKLR